MLRTHNQGGSGASHARGTRSRASRCGRSAPKAVTDAAGRLASSRAPPPVLLGHLDAPLAQVRIAVGAVLDEDRRCEQVVGLAEHVRKVAGVGGGDRGGLVAVYDDARRIAAALVGVAQF